MPRTQLHTVTQWPKCQPVNTFSLAHAPLNAHRCHQGCSYLGCLSRNVCPPHLILFTMLILNHRLVILAFRLWAIWGMNKKLIIGTLSFFVLYLVAASVINELLIFPLKCESHYLKPS